MKPIGNHRVFFWASAICIAAVFSACMTPSLEEEGTGNQGGLVGAWADAEGRRVLNLDEDSLHIFVESGVYTQDESKDPKWLDFRTGDEDASFNGIYEMRGDTLVLAIQMGREALSGKRPVSFDIDTADTQDGLLLWRLLKETPLREVTAAKWSKANVPKPNYPYILCFQDVGDLLFAGGSQGLLRSEDEGINWTQTSLHAEVKAMAVLQDAIFAAGSRGVFVSRDRGATWTASNAGFTSAPDGIPQVVALTVIGTNLLAGIHGGIFLSEDAGSTWKRTSEHFVRGFAAGPSGAYATIGGMTPRLLKSQDGGLSWNEISIGSPLGSIIGDVLVLDPAGQTLIVGTGERGVLISTDQGATWQASNQGLPPRVGGGVNAEGLAVHEGTLYTLTDQGIYTSLDTGSTWIPHNEGFQDYSFSSRLHFRGDREFLGSYQRIWIRSRQP